MAEQRKRRTRTTPRVTSTEPAGDDVDTVIKGQRPGLTDGTLEVTISAAEKVPVAQYANVTIGPITARCVIPDPGLDKLVGVDPEDWDEDQQAIADRFKSEISTRQSLIEEVISEDREAVEESVRLFNEREAEDRKKANKKTTTS